MGPSIKHKLPFYVVCRTESRAPMWWWWFRGDFPVGVETWWKVATFLFLHLLFLEPGAGAFQLSRKCASCLPRGGLCSKPSTSRLQFPAEEN